MMFISFFIKYPLELETTCYISNQGELLLIQIQISVQLMPFLWLFVKQEEVQLIVDYV